MMPVRALLFASVVCFLGAAVALGFAIWSLSTIVR